MPPCARARWGEGARRCVRARARRAYDSRARRGVGAARTRTESAARPPPAHAGVCRKPEVVIGAKQAQRPLLFPPPPAAAVAGARRRRRRRRARRPAPPPRRPRRRARGRRRGRGRERARRGGRVGARQPRAQLVRVQGGLAGAGAGGGGRLRRRRAVRRVRPAALARACTADAPGTSGLSTRARWRSSSCRSEPSIQACQAFAGGPRARSRRLASPAPPPAIAGTPGTAANTMCGAAAVRRCGVCGGGVRAGRVLLRASATAGPSCRARAARESAARGCPARVARLAALPRREASYPSEARFRPRCTPPPAADGARCSDRAPAQRAAGRGVQWGLLCVRHKGREEAASSWGLQSGRRCTLAARGSAARARQPCAPRPPSTFVTHLDSSHKHTPPTPPLAPSWATRASDQRGPAARGAPFRPGPRPVGTARRCGRRRRAPRARPRARRAPG